MLASFRSLVFGLVLSVGVAASAADASSFQTLYSFTGGADGSSAYGRLVMDSAGILYGVTVSGGDFSRGTVFSLDPASSTLTTLYSFTDGADGGNPQTGLALDAKGNLYGVTGAGGSTVNCNLGCGTMFKLNVSSKKFTVLHTFTGLADGSQPFGALLLVGNTLYGTTTYGGTGGDCGSNGCGTLFKFVLPSKIFTTAHEMVFADGANPMAVLSRGKSGLLYGSAPGGGTTGRGTVFSFDTASNTVAVLHNFDYHVDGAYSAADLTIKDGFIYGTTRVGGPTDDSDGTIYKLELSTNILTTLYSFTGQGDGLFPTYGVVFGPSERLYGGTDQGGGSGAGVLFRFSPKNLAFKTIHDFSGADGSFPSGSLLYASGSLYGVTSGGHGTVFKIIP